MKIFVPMSDELLDRRGDASGRLVPFDPEFIAGRKLEGHKPANWITESDYRSACKRLWASRESKAYSV